MKKMKSFMLFAVTVLLLAVMLCMNASAAEWIAIDEKTFYSFDEETAVMIIKGADSVLKGRSFGVDCYDHYKDYCECLDREYDDWPIFTKAEKVANEAAKKTKTLIVSEGIVELGTSVFTEFVNAEVIILPQSVTKIPDGAFSGLTKLRTVVLSNSTTSIGEAAFYHCKGLQSLYVPDSVETLGNGAFFRCDTDAVRIPETAKWETKVLFTPAITECRAFLGNLNASIADGCLESAYYDGGVEYYTYDKATNKYTTIGSAVFKFGGDDFKFRINVPAGKKYDFVCRYYLLVNGKKVYSEYSDVVTYAVAPDMKRVEPSVSEITSNSLKITWKKCANAEGYRVYKKIPGNKWETVGTTKNLGGTIKNLKPGTTYRLIVKPYTKVEDEVVWGTSYYEVTVSTLPEAPTVKVSSTSKGKITVSWNAVNGAQKYQLYYKKGNGSYVLYKTYDSAQNLTFSNLKSGTKYTFAVRACRTLKTQDYLTDYKVVKTDYRSTYTPVAVKVK